MRRRRRYYKTFRTVSLAIMQTYTKTRFRVRKLSPYGRTPICQRCRRRPITEIHHIDGRVGIRFNDPFNLIALCRTCHDEIHTKLANDYEFRQSLLAFIAKDLSRYWLYNAPKNKTAISQWMPTGQEVQDESIQVLWDRFDSNVAPSEYPEGYPFVN